MSNSSSSTLSLEQGRDPLVQLLLSGVQRAFASVPRRVYVWAACINVIVLAVVVTMSVLATPMYRSDALLIPKSVFSSSAPDLSGGAQAAMLGLNLGGAGAKLTPFEAVLKSPAVIDKFIESSGIRQAEKKDYIEDYRDLVSNIVLVDFRKDGTITIAAEDKSPASAQRYARAYVEAFEQVSKTVAANSAKGQVDVLTSVLDQAKANYGSLSDRVKRSRIDESVLRSDPSALTQTLGQIEARILDSSLLLARLEQSMTPSNPAVATARANHQQLLAARERLLSASPAVQQSGEQDPFPLEAALSRQMGTFVGAYTQAREKMLLDAMMAASPFIVAQQPTLPEKRVRPQRRRMIVFSLMTQMLATIAVLGVIATLRMRFVPQHA